MNYKNFTLFPGSHILLEKLRKYKPKIAVFNGKLIYEVFSGKKEFGFGRQPSLVDGTNTVRKFLPDKKKQTKFQNKKLVSQTPN